MSTIKFRGKRIDNKEWVYGYLYKLPLPCGEACMILTQDNNHLDNSLEPKYHLAFTLWVDLFLVDHATVGQFTGLYGINGEEIYEDDIIQQRDVKVIVEYYRGAFGYTRLIQHRVRIAPGASNVVQEPVFIPFIGSDDNSNALKFPDGTVFDTDYCEVIGNIHDNPELIEKGGEK